MYMLMKRALFHVQQFISYLNSKMELIFQVCWHKQNTLTTTTFSLMVTEMFYFLCSCSSTRVKSIDCKSAWIKASVKWPKCKNEHLQSTGVLFKLDPPPNKTKFEPNIFGPIINVYVRSISRPVQSGPKSGISKCNCYNVDEHVTYPFKSINLCVKLHSDLSQSDLFKVHSAWAHYRSTVLVCFGIILGTWFPSLWCVFHKNALFTRSREVKTSSICAAWLCLV